MDKYEKYVGDMVTALRGEDESAIGIAFERMGTLALDELLAELCVWVDEVTLDRDLDGLIAIVSLPLPENPKAFIEAVHRNDVHALHAYSGGDLVKLLASMLSVIASMQEANERL